MQDYKEIAGYQFRDHGHCHSHLYLLPQITTEIDRFIQDSGQTRRIFDLGCGNGSVAAHFAKRGFEISGVDVSSEGIQHANAAFPQLRLELGSAYDDLAAKFGTYPIVLSLEVVEHVYAPRRFAETLHSLVQPGGIAIVSTPYHGYWKNLGLAALGKLDSHFTALWDHGHIKFWSVATLSTLLRDAGFKILRFHRVGRIPVLAKSMIAVAVKPK